ncbi:tumor necrosis factor ligand superfamily member 11-like [Acipenser ruthenus]|uniref:tumor necrosis factor ligand superfamily member 11-like n=1 Tax=Acipenser ruthenus TaxID=7906 RepID=UPI00145B91E8|nr:tumor necrosis factor ligand superfamily member 11-like [Acipenser ruthenus]
MGSTARMENIQPRFDSVPIKESTSRCFIVRVLLIMGLLQIASSVALLLYFSHQIAQVSSKGSLQNNAQCLNESQWKAIQDLLAKNKQESLPPVADALIDPRKKFRVAEHPNCKTKKDRKHSVLPPEKPSAHLPIQADKNFIQNTTAPTMIYWDSSNGLAHIHNMSYSDGKIKVNQEGLYYVYAKTCFRHNLEVSEELRAVENGIQLLQYVYHTKHTRQHENLLLMKSGSVKHWNRHVKFRFYCIHQGGLFPLKSGDDLFVKVSYASLLDPTQEASYLGAFKLSNLE